MLMIIQSQTMDMGWLEQN